MIGVGVVGYGYWGPNLVRNFWQLPDADLRWVCDTRADRLAGARAHYPSVRTTENYADLLADPKVDAIAVATPVSSHFSVAMEALRAGKHVLVEKPMTASSAQAERLVEEAARRNLVLAVDHTFVHTGAVRKMHSLVRDSLGEIYYYDSVRVNLGLFQHDVNVIWDLAVHDLSIMDHVLPEKPVAVAAAGMNHVPGGPANIAYLTLFFDSSLIAHVHVNWLAPVKVRRTLVGGSQKMIVYDDLEPSEKIKVYDKGIMLSGSQLADGDQMRQMLVGYRAGDMMAPRLELTEALSVELAEFIDSIMNGSPLSTDGEAGLRVVGVLEAASLSLAQRGRVVDLVGATRAA